MDGNGPHLGRAPSHREEIERFERRAFQYGTAAASAILLYLLVGCGLIAPGVASGLFTSAQNYASLAFVVAGLVVIAVLSELGIRALKQASRIRSISGQGPR